MLIKMFKYIFFLICIISDNVHAYLEEPYINIIKTEKELDFLKSCKEYNKINSYTNITYHFICRNQSEFDYILRINESDKGFTFKISEQQEYENLEKVQKLFNVPEITAFKEGKYQLFKYINHDKKLSDADVANKGTLVQIIIELKKLHNSNVVFSNRIDLFEMLDAYLTEEISERLHDNNIIKARSLLKKYLNTLPPLEKLYPIHGDMVASNILIKNKKIILLDWEYSGMSYPIWDLAFLSVNSNFTTIDDNLMLMLYDEDKFIQNLIRLKLFKRIVYLWKFCWFNQKLKFIGESPTRKEYEILSIKYLDMFISE
jgi:thiamine kinase-like enzyme